jgi:hypothetical protein
MNTYRLYTGPTLVPNVAQLLSEYGFFEVFEGTSHVFFKTQLGYDAAFRLLKGCVSGFNPSDLQLIHGIKAI